MLFLIGSAAFGFGTAPTPPEPSYTCEACRCVIPKCGPGQYGGLVIDGTDLHDFDIASWSGIALTTAFNCGEYCSWTCASQDCVGKELAVYVTGCDFPLANLGGPDFQVTMTVASFSNNTYTHPNKPTSCVGQHG